MRGHTYLQGVNVHMTSALRGEVKLTPKDMRLLEFDTDKVKGFKNLADIICLRPR